MSSGAGGYVAAGATGFEAMIEIQVQCLNGEGCKFCLSGSALGHELRQMVLQLLPSKKGRRFTLHHQDAPLLLTQTLQEQGIVGKMATVSCTFVPTDLHAAWCYAQGFPVSLGECALDGVTNIEGTNSCISLQYLPGSLETLALGDKFNQTLEPVRLPSGLQTLEFGDDFNQTLERVSLPSGLQTLEFGHDFDQTLEGVSLPSGLQTLTFGYSFNQPLDRVSFPSGLQTLTFGFSFNQPLDRVSFPSGLQTLTFGDSFNQTLERVSFPIGLQTLTFGPDFDQTLEVVRLPSGLVRFCCRSIVMSIV
jgi:hypothetical protein